ncbi:O-antigen ligase family protein [Paenibacillus lentus]|uniref:O-antigen ligase family protein n=1 Tax=Paenibacillus lentus TaxID=1338368 RepID=UPI0013DDEF30|nr:O-antigen ligase family protein [Paenibacillus lentus]
MNRGLYFDDTLLTLGLMLIGITMTALILMGKAVSGQRISRKLLDERQSVYKIQLTHIFVLGGSFLIAGLYAAHLVFSPLSLQATGEAMLKWCFYGCFGLLIYCAGRCTRGKEVLETGWSFLGLLLGATALASVYGLLPYPEAIFRTDQSELSASGARLAGLLQYPNTFGAVMGVFLLERLIYLAQISAANYTRQQRWRIYAVAGSSYIYIVCLLLTESRGAYIAVATAGLAGFLQLQGADRYRYARQSGVLFFFGLVTAGQLFSARLAPPLLSGLLIFVTIMCAALAGVQHLTSFGAGRIALRSFAGSGLARITRDPLIGRGVRWLAAPSLIEPGIRHGIAGCLEGARVRRVAASSIVLVTVLLIAWLSIGPLERMYSLATASSRLLMYRDAWRLFLTSPWFGQGGGTWDVMYRAIQATPYVGREVHSGYINILLEIGLTGLVVLMLWLAVFGVVLARQRCRIWPSSLVILLHSIVDFDMSYGLIWLLMIWMACSGISQQSDLPLTSSQPQSDQPKPPIRSIEPVNRKEPAQFVQPHQAVYTVRLVTRHIWYIFVLVVMSVFLLLASLLGARQATSLAWERQALAAKASGMTEQAKAFLEQSLSIYPARTSARLQLAGLSDDLGAAKMLQQGLVYDRAEPDLWAALGRALSGLHPKDAVSAWEHAVRLDPFSRTRQTEAISHLTSLVHRLQREQRLQEAVATALIGYRLYVRYEELANKLAMTIMKRNDRSFMVTAEAKYLGRQLGEYVFRHPPGHR